MHTKVVSRILTRKAGIHDVSLIESECGLIETAEFIFECMSLFFHIHHEGMYKLSEIIQPLETVEL